MNSNNGIQLNMAMEIELEKEEDIVNNLWDIIDRYDRKIIHPPLHQRDAGAWDDNKKREWIKRISDKSTRPVGVIVTYQLNNGEDSPVFINDGLQRISATSEYKNFPELYGDTKEHAEKVIRSTNMPRQHRWYKEHTDALLDFQRLNFGTPLTPYEYFAGIIRYMKGYEDIWKPLLDRVHNVVAIESARVMGKKKSSGKKQLHNYKRSDYGLLYRFVSGDTVRSPYGTATGKIKLDDIYKLQSIESKLRNILESIGIFEARRQVSMFEDMVKRETSLLERIWLKTETGKKTTMGMMPNTYRHLIDVAIWKRNLKISNHIWEDYVEKLLINTQGAASLINKDDSRSRVPLSLNDLNRLSRICKWIGSELHSTGDSERKRQQRSHQIKDGYDISHVLPLGESDVLFY